MTIKTHDKIVQDIYINGQEISKVYVGENEVYNFTAHDWSTSSWENLKRDLEKHRNGIINLYDSAKHPGWEIGKTRTIQLGAIPRHDTVNLTGTAWWFNGREGSPVEIDIAGLPSLELGEKWDLTFSYYTYKLNGSKWEYTWEGDFNALCSGTGANDAYMCYTKVLDSGNVQTPVCTNVIEGEEYVAKWNRPSGTYQLYKDSGGNQILSEYQEIKITGGEDAENTEVIAWLRENATCSEIPDEASESETSIWAYEVPEADTQGQQITLRLSSKATSINESGKFIANKGYTLATGSPYEESSIPNQMPAFVVEVVEVLNDPGILLHKTGTTDVTTKSKYTGTFPTLPNRGYFKSGDSGKQVKNVQNFLNWAISANLSPDGSYGSKTTAAVKTFQGTVGISKDGKFGPKTLAKARSYEKTTTTKVATSGGSNNGSWGGTVRKNWFDLGFYNALPDDLKSIVQEFNWNVGYGDTTDGVLKFSDKAAVPLECNIFDTQTNSTNAEFNTDYLWDYYKNNPNARKKTKADTTPAQYWLASPVKNKLDSYCAVLTDGEATTCESNKQLHFSPFFII